MGIKYRNSISSPVCLAAPPKQHWDVILAWLRRLPFVALVPLMLLQLAPPTALAITEDQRQALDQGVYYFNTEDCGVSTSSSTLTGNDNLQQIFNYFSDNGYTVEQAAGIVGNIWVESHGDPEIWEADGKDYQTPPQPDSGSEGWGIAQWTPANKILNYAQATDQPAYELSTQVAFLLAQLNGTAPNNNEAAAGTLLQQTTTVDDAAVSFMQNYERPTDDSPTGPNALNREALAEQAYALYAASAQSTSGVTTTSATDGCSPTGSGGGGSIAGCSDFGTGTGDFTTDTTTTYPNVTIMCQRAQQLSAGTLPDPLPNQPSSIWCSNLRCADLCDHVAGVVWGYSASGYLTSYKHWTTMVAQGDAHPLSDADGRDPPVGALLFYKDPSTPGYPQQDDGHTVVYLGNNMVISSDITSSGQYSPGDISIVSADKIEGPGFGDIYLGWSNPVFNSTQDDLNP